MNAVTEFSAVRNFSQSDFDDFAKLSGDDNPIHTDHEYSAKSRFGRTVAHGLLLCSVLRGLIEQLLPGGHLQEQSVKFPAPTYAGDEMSFTVTEAVRDLNDGRTQISFELQVVRITDGVVTCQGSGSVIS